MEEEIVHVAEVLDDVAFVKERVDGHQAGDVVAPPEAEGGEDDDEDGEDAERPFQGFAHG